MKHLLMILGAIMMILVSVRGFAQHNDPSSHDSEHKNEQQHHTSPPHDSGHQTQSQHHSQHEGHGEEGHGAKDQPQELNTTTDAMVIDSALIKVNRRQPIAFVPFEMQDPTTKRAIPPDEMLTLKSGRKVLARDYFAGLNELEKRANALGYSLRDTETQTPLYEIVIDQAELQKQQSDWLGTYVQNVGDQSHSDFATDFDAQYKEMLVQSSQRQEQFKLTATIDPKIPAPVQTVKRYSTSYGNRNYFAVSKGGTLILDGSDMRTATTTETSFDASILGWNLNLLAVKGTSSAPRSDVNASLLVKNEFQTILPIQNWSDPRNLLRQDSVTKKIEQSKSMMLYPLGYPVRVTFGVSVESDCEYSFAVVPWDTRTQITPEVKSEVFAKADTYVPSPIPFVPLHITVGGRLTLLDYKMPVLGRIDVNLDDANGKKYYFQSYSISESITTLRGNIYAQGCFEYILDDYCPGWMRFDIYKGNGFTANGTLGVGSQRTYWTLGQPF